MAKKTRRRKPARQSKTATVKSKPRRAAPRRVARRSASSSDPLLAAVRGAERREIGHVRLEVGRAGAARVKRMIYPPGFRWSVDMRPAVGTDLCMHAHVGFLARGEIHIEYADGCTGHDESSRKSSRHAVISTATNCPASLPRPTAASPRRPRTVTDRRRLPFPVTLPGPSPSKLLDMSF